MPATLPPRLQHGDHVRVVAPSTAVGAVGDPWPWHDIAQQRLGERGLTVSFGERAVEHDRLGTGSVQDRVDDLHDAFADPEVHGIFTFLGGFHANEILDSLDMDLIGSNPKMFCGYSDITVLHHAMLAGAGLVTYCGPHYTTFGMRDHVDQTLAWFDGCVLKDDPAVIRPVDFWTDDLWFVDQDDRNVVGTDGWWVLREGHAEGTLLGGNLCTLNLLQGTRWFPDLTGAVLVVEDDELTNAHLFARDLQSLLHQPGGDALAGLLIGRFQEESNVSRADVEAIVTRFPSLRDIPVVANVDVGHTNPFFTFPVGGTGRMSATAGDPHVVLVRH